MVDYISTRGHSHSVGFSEAILNPNAESGGLYVPDSFSDFSSDLKTLMRFTYEELAEYILKSFGVDIDSKALSDAVRKYRMFDNPSNPAPVVKLDRFTYVQELWHGPTRAFKDKALQPFPYMLSYLAVKSGKKYLVATATSGDTGPAALEGFRDLPNTRVICFYPVAGTSNLQAEQMLKAAGKNVKVVAVNTDFDGIQANLKSMLRNDEIKSKLAENGYELSAANSVNFGRIVFQVVYHFWSYLELVRNGEIRLGNKINYVIPSGNFGNALGAFYAKEMGLPISKIIVASNENNVLSDFINFGLYDITSRELIKTNSPAMDILISSNVERVLHYIFGSRRTLELMTSLEKEKYFQLKNDEVVVLQSIFMAIYAKDDIVESTIAKVYDEFNYLIDPHTAVAFFARNMLSSNEKSIIVSTAEWTKFAETIGNSLGCDGDIQTIVEKTGVELSKYISDLESLPIVHNTVIDKEGMFDELFKFVWTYSLN